MTPPFRASALALACAACAPSITLAQSAPESTTAEPIKRLGTITVTGRAPSSLPTEIPAAMHGITAEQLAQQINATDSSDALKYLPSLNVRKRHIGDYDHAVIASRASGTANSARSLVFADGVPLANLLGNGAAYTPRWGMVEPQEIERVDVMLGPFSASYSGNSVGAVVDYVTRMPRGFEAHATLGLSTQRFGQYSPDTRSYASQRVSAGIGHRIGPWAFRLSLSQSESDSQPLAWTTRLASQGTAPGTGAVAVTGAVADFNPRNQPWLVLGETNLASTRQTQAKARASYDFSPLIRATYTLGQWENTASRDAQSYLRDAAGNAVYAGPVLIGGQRYTLAGTDFAIRQEALRHVLHGFTLAQRGDATLNWRVTASKFDYAQDEVRASTTALPAARSGGAGTLTRMEGTGWQTLAASATYRAAPNHTIEFGAQREAYRLDQQRFNTAQWIDGAGTALTGLSQGETRLQSLYAQDAWAFAEDWRAVIGLRYESWRAQNGVAQGTAAPTRFADRSESTWSPKFSLAHQWSAQWEVKLATGRALRWPTVAELYQSTGSLGTTINNDPNLKPERSQTTELSAQRGFGAKNSLRATLFLERTQDAPYSQTHVNTNVTNVQNIDRIRTNGLELALQSKDWLVPGLEFNASLTYADSIITANAKNPSSVGKWQPRVPQWRANAMASYQAGGGFTHTLGLRHSGRQFSQLDNSDTYAYAYQCVSEFTVLDWRTHWQFAPQWALAVGIDNLANQRYWAFHAYPARTLHAQLTWQLR